VLRNPLSWPAIAASLLVGPFAIYSFLSSFCPGACSPELSSCVRSDFCNFVILDEFKFTTTLFILSSGSLLILSTLIYLWKYFVSKNSAKVSGRLALYLAIGIPVAFVSRFVGAVVAMTLGFGG
jgi:hypothetical protein